MTMAPGRKTSPICTISRPNPRCRCSRSSKAIAASAAMVRITASSIGRRRRPTAPSPPNATPPSADVRAGRRRGEVSRSPAATTQAAAPARNTPAKSITLISVMPAMNATQEPVSWWLNRRGKTAESSASRSLTIARTDTHSKAPPAPPIAAAGYATAAPSATEYPNRLTAYRRAPSAATLRRSRRSARTPASGRTATDTTISMAISRPTAAPLRPRKAPAHNGRMKSTSSFGPLVRAAAMRVFRSRFWAACGSASPRSVMRTPRIFERCSDHPERYTEFPPSCPPPRSNDATVCYGSWSTSPSTRRASASDRAGADHGRPPPAIHNERASRSASSRAKRTGSFRSPPSASRAVP